MKKKLLIITQYFSPEPFMYSDVIEYLTEKCDCKVWVITGKPNYPDGDFRRYETKYKWGPKITLKSEGLKVSQIPQYGRGNSIKRILNYCTFPASLMLYLWLKRRK